MEDLDDPVKNAAPHWRFALLLKSIPTKQTCAGPACRAGLRGLPRPATSRGGKNANPTTWNGRSLDGDSPRGSVQIGVGQIGVIQNDFTAYAILNPVRAGLAATPEQSDFTNGPEHIADQNSSDDVSTAGASGIPD